MSAGLPFSTVAVVGRTLPGSTALCRGLDRVVPRSVHLFALSHFAFQSLISRAVLVAKEKEERAREREREKEREREPHNAFGITVSVRVCSVTHTRTHIEGELTGLCE